MNTMTESEPLQRWHAFDRWVADQKKEFSWPRRTDMYIAFKAGWNAGKE